MLILLSAVLSFSMICLCFYLTFEEHNSLPTVTFDFACIAFVIGFTLFLCLSLLAYFDPDFNYARTMRESRRIVAQPSMLSKLCCCRGSREEEIEEGTEGTYSRTFDDVE
ncbi:hypothetical protein PRIPAC_97548, partial [Pristionchus pacificus]|uniref:Uncharacterized protein n=1 Tax=Pristionchus pacificus TaxID=54126 RepID=A0A2A6CU17_PRIPA